VTARKQGHAPPVARSHTAERSLRTLLISPAAADTEKVSGPDRYDSIAPSTSRNQKAARPDVTSEQKRTFPAQAYPALRM
jgi:hypothetical protein